MKMNQFKRATVVLHMIAAATCSAASAEYSIGWYTIDGGGAVESTGGGFTLSGTIGQADAGDAISGGQFVMEPGFWPGVTGPAPAGPADCDLDGDIDLSDYECFHACVTGPGGGVLTDCGAFDTDADGDVDLLDWPSFQGAFSGS